MDDPFVVGTMIGLAADLPKIAIDFLLYHWRFSEYHCWLMAIKAFFSPDWPVGIHHWLIGGALDLTIAGFLGVGLVYFIRLIGPGCFWLKGIAYSMGTWLGFCLMASGHLLQNPLEVYHSFINHSLWAVVAIYWLAKRERGWLKGSAFWKGERP